MKTNKFDDGSYTVLGIKSSSWTGSGDGIFDPNGKLRVARIVLKSGAARKITKSSPIWDEIQSVGGVKARKKKAVVRRPLIPRPRAVRKKVTRKVPAKAASARPFQKPKGRKISREEQYRHDFREEQKAIAARIQGKEYVPTRYPEPRPKADSGNYSSFGAWASAVRRAGGTVRSQLSEPQSAYNRSGDMIGEWDGQSGMIIRKNPVRQRIAVSLSKSRRNPFNDRNLDA